jgi:hypothetical protein
MAELKRKEQELSTADLARTPEKPHLVKGQDVEAPPDSRRPVQSVENRTIDNRVKDDHLEQQQVRAIRDEDRTREMQRVTDNQRGTPARAEIQSSPLFSENETSDFRSRWSDIQAGFVDEPRQAVQNADQLVAQLMKKLAEGFANERQKLEHAWDRGENVSTEDLRVALQRYRSFFHRLLAA